MLLANLCCWEACLFCTVSATGVKCLIVSSLSLRYVSYTRQGNSANHYMEGAWDYALFEILRRDLGTNNDLGSKQWREWKSICTTYIWGQILEYLNTFQKYLYSLKSQVFVFVIEILVEKWGENTSNNCKSKFRFHYKSNCVLVR